MHSCFLFCNYLITLFLIYQLNFCLKQKRIFTSENPFLVSLRTTNFGDKSTIKTYHQAAYYSRLAHLPYCCNFCADFSGITSTRCTVESLFSTIVMNSKKTFSSKYTYMIKLNCYLLIAVGVDNKTFKLSGGDIATHA